MRPTAVVWLLGLGALLPSGPAKAFIEKLYSFREVLDESTHIVTGRLSAVDGRQRTAVGGVERAIKGTGEFKTVRMNIALGPDHHAQYLMERLRDGEPFILFYRREGGAIAALVHAGDTWFQLFATDDPKGRDRIWWRHSHIEVALGRTYNGATAPLIALTADVLAGRVEAPPPDPAVPRLDVRSPVRAQAVAPKDGSGWGFARRVEFKQAGGSEVRGVSIADVNGDDLLDLLFCRQSGNLLLLNQQGGFRDATGQFGLAAPTRSAVWADYDGDDHPDLLTNDYRLWTHWAGRFRDDSPMLAKSGPRNTEGAAWIDYDGDGWPDVLIADADGLRLFRNAGAGPRWFADVSEQVGLGPKGLGVGNGDFLAVLDYDGDGYPDFIHNLGDGVVARNRGGRGFEADGRTGIKLAGGSGYKRGLAVADFDNDGDLDVFVPGPGRPQLYRNNNDGTFTDVIESAGDLAKLTAPSFSAAWGDVNGDGLLDLLVCCPASFPRLFLGDGTGRFTDATEAMGLHTLKGTWAAGLADLDGDGALDLALNRTDGVVVAFNSIARPANRGVVLVQVRARRGLVGAVVRALDERGRLLAMRPLSGADGPGGQLCPVAHLALPLGDCRVIVSLSDGRAAEKTVTVSGDVARLVFADGEFN